MAHEDAHLTAINRAIARAMGQLEDESLTPDVCESIEKELSRLVGMRLATERQAQATSAPA